METTVVSNSTGAAGARGRGRVHFVLGKDAQEQYGKALKMHSPKSAFVEAGDHLLRCIHIFSLEPRKGQQLCRLYGELYSQIASSTSEAVCLIKRFRATGTFGEVHPASTVVQRVNVVPDFSAGSEQSLEYVFVQTNVSWLDLSHWNDGVPVRVDPM